MAIYALGGDEPRIHPTAFVHPQATIIGRVEIGAEASIWPQAVLRGDNNAIRIGDRTSVQDGTVIHTSPEFETVVGRDSVVGHLAHLEGCTIESGVLVGNGAVVLHEAVARSGSLIGSNAVVTNRTEIPSGALAIGVPAKIVPDKVDPAVIQEGVEAYVAKATRYRAQMRRLD